MIVDAWLRFAAWCHRLVFGLRYNPFSVRLGIRQAARGEGRMLEDVMADLRRRYRKNTG